MGEILNIYNQDRDELIKEFKRLIDTEKTALMRKIYGPSSADAINPGFELIDKFSYDRMKNALDDLQTISSDERNLCSILFGEENVPQPKESKKVDFINENLDYSQQLAIQFTLGQDKVCFIDGPHGTGKTTVLIELVRQLYRESKRVLVCCPSNSSLDNIIEKMLSDDFNSLIRLGNPNQASSLVQQNVLDVIMESFFPQNHDPYRTLHRGNESIKQGRPEYEDFSEEYIENLLRVLEADNVIFGTPTDCNSWGILGVVTRLARVAFDVVIFDDVSEILLPTFWPVISMTKKAIFIGNKDGLRPKVLDVVNATKLERSIFDEYLALKSFKALTVNLRTQHRSYIIIEWMAEHFKTPTNNEPVKENYLTNIAQLLNWPNVVVVDTKDCSMHETAMSNGDSFENECEADLATNYARFIIVNGVHPEEIGIMSLFTDQVQLIKSRIKDLPELQVKKLYGFKGREKEVIIISFVRSNPKKEWENITESRLMDLRNLTHAISRTRKHLVIICDSQTVGKTPNMKSFLEYMRRHGPVLSPGELLHSSLEKFRVFIQSLLRDKEEEKRKTENFRNKLRRRAMGMRRFFLSSGRS